MVREMFNGLVKERGFRKGEGSVFTRNDGDVLDALCLSKSRWGPQFYLDAGVIHPRARLEDIKTPMLWHVSSRVDRIVDETHEFRSALDEGSSMSRGERERVMRAALDLLDRVLFGRFGSPVAIEEFARELRQQAKPWLVPLSMVEYAKAQKRS